MPLTAAEAAEYAVLTAQDEAEKSKNFTPQDRREFIPLRAEEVLKGLHAPPEAVAQLQGYVQRAQAAVEGIKEMVPESLKPLGRNALRYGGGAASMIAEAFRQTLGRPAAASLNASYAAATGAPILPAVGRGLTLQEERTGTEVAQAMTPAMRVYRQKVSEILAQLRGAPVPAFDFAEQVQEPGSATAPYPRVRTELTPQQLAGFVMEITNPGFYAGGAVLGGATRGLAKGARVSRQMAQAAPFLDTMTPAEKLAAAAGKGMQAVGEAGTVVKDVLVPQRVQDVLARNLTYRAGRTKEYLAEREANRAALSVAEEESLDVVKNLAKLTPEEQLRGTVWMTQMATVPLPVQAAIDRLVKLGHPIPAQLLKDFPAAAPFAAGDKPIAALVNPARRIIDGLTDTVIKDYFQGGFVKNPEAAIAAFEAQRGKHLPIIYKTFTNPMQLAKPPGFDLASILSQMTPDQLAAYKMLNPKGQDRILELIRAAATKSGARPVTGGREFTMPTGFLKARSVTSQAFRTALREETNLAYRVGAITAEENRLVANARLLTWVSKRTPLVSEIAQPGFIQMPPTLSQYGPLAGKWVRAGEAADLKEVVEGIPKWLEVMQKTTGVWKTLRVPYNPAAWMRDNYTSAMLMDYSGFSPTRQPKKLYQAVLALTTKDKLYWEARRGGLEMGTFAQAEGTRLMTGLSLGDDAATMTHKIAVNLAKAYNVPGQAYNFKESMWKMAKYLDEVEQGASVPQAVREAEKWGFDYSKVSRAVRLVRALPVGLPFITFQTKVLPRIIETAIFHPTKIAKWQLLFDSMENLAQQQWKLSDSDLGNMKRHTQGYAIVSPFPQTVFNKDTGKNEERPTVWNLSYLLPWGNVTDEGPFLGLPNIFTPGGPGMVALQAAGNFDLYKKSLGLPIEIGERGASKGEQVRARLNYLYRGSAPVWFPGIPGVTGDAVRLPMDGDEATVTGTIKRYLESIAKHGGFSASKLAASWAGVADFRGIVRQQGWTLLDVFGGIKLNPVDEEEMRRLEFQDYDQALKDLDGYIIRTGMRQDIHEAVKEDKIRGAEERKDKLQAEFEARQPSEVVNATRPGQRR